MTALAVFEGTALACPGLNASKDEFYRFSDNLTSWLPIKRDTWLKFFISEHTLSVLAETGTYPDRQSISNRLKSLNIIDVDIQDICDIVLTILGKTPYLEEVTSLGNCSVSFCDFDNSVVGYTESKFEDQFKYVLLASLKASLELSQGETFVVTHCAKSIRTNVKGSLNSDSGNIDLDGWLGICSELGQLESLLCTTTFWMNADGNFHSDALQIHCKQLDKRPNKEFGFGNDFLKSAISHGFTTQASKIKTLLKSLVETICDENLGKTHGLRQNSSGNSPQLTSGSFKAMRRDIDYEYHLHYWISGNVVEFANLVVHNDMTIFPLSTR
ncbi:MAG: hypothetical protein WC028_30470 [Candidatus Obscuribacterales bacterium]